MSSEYLAQTPEHWLVLRLKHVVSLRSDRVTGDAQQENYLGLENVESWTGKVTRPENSIREEEKDNSENMVGVFHEGDILFGKLRPYLAKAFLADFSGVCSTEFLVMRPKDFVDPRYLLKAILTHQFIDEVDATTFGVRMPRANWDAISNIFIPIPPLATQRAIADYLDRETARIDGLIGAKQRLLGLLAEKRRALITHAVTRGLDPSAATRPSGVPWIGDVPAGWEITSIRYVGRIGNGSTPRRDNNDYWKDGTFPWLTSTVVNDDMVGEPLEYVTDVALKECHLPIVTPNSVLIAITGEGRTRGKAAVLPYTATINQHMAYITPDHQVIHYQFLQRFLTGSYEILRMISEGTGSTKGALTCEQIADFPIVLPPLFEQIRIIERLDSQLEQIDNLVRSTQASLTLLQERRTALIAAAVTGQIDTAEVV